MAREDAAVDGRMYYHEECYGKKVTKERIREVLNKFPVRDVNISLSKAIDDNDYPVGLVEYIANNKLSKFQNAYGLLYQLKIEDNYKEYVKLERGKLLSEINKAVREMDIEPDTLEFEYKPNKNRRLDIY